AVLGVPSSPGAAGYLLLAFGLVVAVGALVVLRDRLRAIPLVEAAALGCLVVTAGATPYLVWRVVEDLRYTTRLDAYSGAAAGPIQASLPGHLVGGAVPLVPRGATYATAVGANIPWSQARAAFPSLALQTLFPRRSVSDRRTADYVVTWGVRPAAVAPVTR